MANSARKNKTQRGDKRYGHKKARQATRRALENGHVEGRVQSMHYSTRVEQPPIPDVSVGPPKPKKKGCKRNSYGPHIIVAVRMEPRYVVVFNEETGKYEHKYIPWYQCRYRPPYECMKCHKAFYRVPKGAQRGDAHVIIHNSEQVQMDDHYDQFNIKMRLLGLKCKCLECRGDQ